MRTALPGTSHDFNPRSPHGERHGGGVLMVSLEIFQSTLPARGATPLQQEKRWKRQYFNPRSPHGERHVGRQRYTAANAISIHAPRTGSDKRIDAAFFCVTVFQSTLPARGATLSLKREFDRVIFQSTLPARGATAAQISVHAQEFISIHAPRTGSDQRGERNCRWNKYDFNPRSPHGERLEGRKKKGVTQDISIHAPRTGSDRWWGRDGRRGGNFNPRSPHGERLFC